MSPRLLLLLCVVVLAWSCKQDHASTDIVTPRPDQGARVEQPELPDLASAPDSPISPPDPLAGLTEPVLEPALECEAWLDDHPDKLVRLPDLFEGVVPRVRYPAMHRVESLVHEGHNVTMRGEGTSKTLFQDTGADIASRWRALGCGMGGLFVLRDSLFSQQDHVLAHEPFALMMPPNWVTQAAWLVQRGEPIVNVAAFPEDDDQAWKGASDEAIFGSFPPSSSVLEAVRYPVGSGADLVKVARAKHGRRALLTLHGHVQAMQAAAPSGWRAVAKAGAARIAWSDRAYFGESLRRDVIIPILVEHPNPHEVEEGKGMLWKGASAEIPEELVRTVTTEVYRARLADGALAVERYDISRPADRARAITLLESLIPDEPGQPDTTLWLWINGPLDPKKKLQGKGPLSYMPVFMQELHKANVDRKRLKLLGKPTTRLARGLTLAARRKALLGAKTQHQEAGLDVLSINLSATALREFAP